MSLSCGADRADEVESPDFGGGRQRAAAGWGHFAGLLRRDPSSQLRVVLYADDTALCAHTL